MEPTLQERVRRLEGFRLRMLGRANAYEAMLIDAWTYIIRKSDDPVATAREIQKKWIEKADQPASIRGVDPVHLDAVSQEYRLAMENLTDLLIAVVRSAESKAGRTRGPSLPS